VVLAVETESLDELFFTEHTLSGWAVVTNYALDGQRLTISPTQAIQPGAVTSFSLGYSLSLPETSPKRLVYLSNQLNLTDWYPFYCPLFGGWVLHNASSSANILVYDSADYDVNVKVNDPDVIIAASARTTRTAIPSIIIS